MQAKDGDCNKLRRFEGVQSLRCLIALEVHHEMHHPHHGHYVVCPDCCEQFISFVDLNRNSINLDSPTSRVLTWTMPSMPREMIFMFCCRVGGAAFTGTQLPNHKDYGKPICIRRRSSLSPTRILALGGTDRQSNSFRLIWLIDSIHLALQQGVASPLHIP